jgi:hypothetical protein
MYDPEAIKDGGGPQTDWISPRPVSFIHDSKVFTPDPESHWLVRRWWRWSTGVEVEGRPDLTLFSTPHCFMGFTCPATLSSRACAPGPAFFSRPTVLVLLTLVRRSHASPINGVVGCRSCTYDRHYTCSLLACIYLLPLPGIFSANAWHTCTQQYTYHGRIMSARRFSWEQTPSDGS